MRHLLALAAAVVLIPAAAAIAAAPAASTVSAADDVTLSVASLRLGVTELDASAAFYTGHLGFRMVMDASEAGFMVLLNGETYLVISQALAPVDLPEGACHVRFNFAAEDLEAAADAMKAAGARFVGEGESAVGRYLTFVDPSGHRHNLKALDKPGADDAGDADAADTPKAPDAPDDAGAAEPGAITVYNVGIAVSDMTKARAFYEQVLGFTAQSEDYYPPVVPYKPAGCASFILSDRGAPTATATAPEAGDGAWAGLALEAADIASAYQTLKARGVRFEHEPRASGPVLHAPFTDPFGNRHELIQHIRPAAPAAHGA